MLPWEIFRKRIQDQLILIQGVKAMKGLNYFYMKVLEESERIFPVTSLK